MKYNAENYDVAVIGAGHAGIEAGLASARLGCKTAVFTVNLDWVGNMPCNPSIGGTSKGHLVREIDALGGEMGVAADKNTLQSRMLNLGKGPAVHSPRAQVDRRAYSDYMKGVLERTPNLYLRQAEIVDITRDGSEWVLRTRLEALHRAKAVILATGAPAAAPEIETDGSVRIASVEDVLSGKLCAGANTVVLGGDFIGCETARFLSRGGSLSPEQLYFLTVHRVTGEQKIDAMLRTTRRAVSIVERGPRVGGGYERGTSWPTMGELKRFGVRQYKSAENVRIEGGRVVFQAPDGPVGLACDTLVVNAPRQPGHTMEASIAARGIPVHTLGDCVHAASAMYAIRDAAELGCTL